METGDWQNPDVEKYINMIRHRAGLPNMDKSVYNSQEKVRELYRRERRVNSVSKENDMMISAVGKLDHKPWQVQPKEHGIRMKTLSSK